MSGLLLASWLVPLGWAVPCGLAGVREVAWRGMALAALPALVLAVLSVTHPPPVVELPWLLTGMRLGLAPGDSPFLLSAALLWLASGIYAVGYLARDPLAPRLVLFLLLAMGGNFGFILAADIVTLYLAYTTMSLATYGLVAHGGSTEALRAARLYMGLAIVSEVAVLSGSVLAVALSWRPDLVAALFFAGFGVKAGFVLLHLWLPPAHAIAPTPASAILSGALVKVGVLGWLRTLAPVEVRGGWETVLIWGGVTGAVYGVLVGLTQAKPKAILAYSSVSQLGLLAMAAGLSLRDGGGSAVGLFVLHHGLVKGALFLGTGLALCALTRAQQRWLKAGLVACALAIAAAPLTGGALVKLSMKSSASTGEGWALTLSSIGSAALMLRFVHAVWPHPGGESRRGTPTEWAGWAFASIAGLLTTWMVAPDWVRAKAFSPTEVFSSLWPLGVGLAAGALVLRYRAMLPKVPLGDLAVPLIRACGGVANYARRHSTTRLPWRISAAAGSGARGTSLMVARWERVGERWGTLLVVFLALVVLLGVLLATRSGPPV